MTYTSASGNTYEVKKTTISYTDFKESGPFKVTQTRYDFFRDGEFVIATFHVDEEHLAATFGEVEGLCAPWETSARD